MMNVLGPTGEGPPRPVTPRSRRLVGAVAAAALVLAGGVTLTATQGLDRGDRSLDTTADTGSGAVAPADTSLARWAEMNGKRFRRPPSSRPRRGVPATTTTVATGVPAPEPPLTPGPPSPAGPTSSHGVQSPVVPPATEAAAATSPSVPRTALTSASAPRPVASSVAAAPAPSTTMVAASPSPTRQATTTFPSTSPSTTTTTTETSATAGPVPSSTTPPPSAGGGGGQVVWEDTFERLDPARWSLEHSTYGDGNRELQCYRPENVAVAGGRLVLRAVTETYTCPNGATRQVTSGMVRSRGVTFSPGQALEFRVKLTPADEADQGGLWPGVWSSGFGAGSWPAGGEMDYLEVMTANNPKRSVYSIHYAKADGSHGVSNKAVVGSANFSAAWHTIRYEYGLDGRLSWYLDGQHVFTVTSAATRQGYPAPFNQPVKEIKINLALGGTPGPLAPGAVGSRGATFEVDYIRVTTL